MKSSTASGLILSGLGVDVGEESPASFARFDGCV